MSSILVGGLDAPAAAADLPEGTSSSDEASIWQLKSEDGSAGAESKDAIDKRIFGIIPNYRTSPSPKDYEPLTTHEKFRLAGEDAFDRGTLVLAAVFAADAQLSHSEPSFGRGVKGFAHYSGTAYADLVIGDYLTEAVFPSLLHQDPRYFRRGTGGVWSRLGYAMGQIFWTHTDAGGEAFNYSEVVGSSMAVAISSAYYPEHRNSSSAISRLSVQIGVDMAANILKEFSPDLSRRFCRMRQRHPCERAAE